jgi:hypothetical protein
VTEDIDHNAFGGAGCMRAWRELLDRGFGKPRQGLEIKPPPIKNPIQELLDESTSARGTKFGSRTMANEYSWPRDPDWTGCFLVGGAPARAFNRGLSCAQALV